MVPADEIIQRLRLQPHPEGGWFRETYRSPDDIPAAAGPSHSENSRSLCTAIYFLLRRGERSLLHRIKSDEIWHFYSGTSLKIHVILHDGRHVVFMLGDDLRLGESFQAVVPAGCWFGAEVTGEGDYALAGCTVSPGFHFNDFELATRRGLLEQYPLHREMITRLTPD